MYVLVLFTSLQNIVILSIIAIVSASIKSTNVVCPHNGTYNLCLFTIFSKTGFVDIIHLCCKSLISQFNLRCTYSIQINAIWFAIWKFCDAVWIIVKMWQISHVLICLHSGLRVGNCHWMLFLDFLVLIHLYFIHLNARHDAMHKNGQCRCVASVCHVHVLCKNSKEL